MLCGPHVPGPPRLTGHPSADLAVLFLIVLIPAPGSLDTTGYPQITYELCPVPPKLEPEPQFPAASSELGDTSDWKVQPSALL